MTPQEWYQHQRDQGVDLEEAPEQDYSEHQSLVEFRVRPQPMDYQVQHWQFAI